MSKSSDQLGQTQRLASSLRALVGKLKRRLREEAPPGDLSWSQAVVLGHIERDGPTTVSALARAENMRPQSMGAIVADLEAVGLLARAPDPADGRRAILSLTPRCRAWIDANRAAREDWLLHTIEKKFSVAEQEDLARGVALLERLVEG